MAMSTRQRGGMRPNIQNQRQPRLTTGRLYEKFKPKSEWKQEDDYDTLLVYLPGFQKEYIKVTTVELNIVRVRGARPIEGNRWSQFQEDYRVPENCEMRGIRSRFDGGILTLTMPRKIVINNATPSTTTATQAAPKTKEQQPFTGTKQDEALPNTKEEPKENKPADKPQSTTPLEAKYTLPPQEPLEKPTPEAKDVVQFTIGSFPKSAPKKDKQDVVEKESVGEKMDLDKGKGKEALVEEETKKDLEEGSKGKQDYEGEVSDGAENKKVVGRRSAAGMVMMNEDRKALVNVGVGILVLVALGVQVSYAIGLIGKGK